MHSEYSERVSVVRDKFRTLDMDLIASCFTDDVVVKYNQLDIMIGNNRVGSFINMIMKRPGEEAGAPAPGLPGRQNLLSLMMATRREGYPPVGGSNAGELQTTRRQS